MSADGVDAVTADSSVAGDDQICEISLEPLHQAALPALVGTEPAAGWGKGTGVDHGELIQWLRTYSIIGLRLVRDSRCALFRNAPVDDPRRWMARAHQDWLWVR